MTMHGLFNQLKLGIISIDNAEHTLFTPYMMESLSSLGVKPDIMDFNSQRDRVKEAFHI